MSNDGASLLIEAKGVDVVMRMTNQMSINIFLNDLYKNNQKNNKYYQQLTTNKRITRLSDDPIGVVRAIQARRDVAKKTQYKSNVEDADSILTQAETSAMQLADLYKRSLELVQSVSTDLYGPAEREAVAEELEGIRNNLVNIGNSTYAGRYLFGGYNTKKIPFEVDASGKLLYNGLDVSASTLDDEAKQIAQYEVDTGTNIDVGVTGIDLLGSGDTNAYKVLDDLIKVIRDDSSSIDDISKVGERLTQVRDDNLALIADIGGRTSRLSLLLSRTEDELVNLETMRGNIEDVDMADAITKLAYATAIYDASLKVGAQIIQPSLVDYLR